MGKAPLITILWLIFIMLHYAWNSLPDDNVYADSLFFFKKHLKSHLYHCAYISKTVVSCKIKHLQNMLYKMF